MFSKKWTLQSPLFDSIFFFSPFFIVFLFTTIGTSYFPELLVYENSVFWFFIFSVIIDVGHVWGTLYRAYIRKEILEKHSKKLIFVPLFSFFLIFILAHIHMVGREWYFAVLAGLAYFAVFHFIKQQVGFVLLYRSKEEVPKRIFSIQRVSDIIIAWTVTLFPFLFWMMHYGEKQINWFIGGEFELLARLIPPNEALWMLYGAIILAYLILQILFVFADTKVNPLKYLYIGGTAYVWYNGMVAYDSLIVFGVGNILLHGLNYYGIVIASSLNTRDSYSKFLQKCFKNMLYSTLSVILGIALLAFIEEYLWDQFIWQEHARFFGKTLYNTVESPLLLSIIIAILGTVQLTHYILDRYIWRKDFGKIF